MSDKKKFTVYVGSVALCVGVAVLLHYVSFTNPYLQSICHLLRPFIYIGLYLVWAISFQKRIIQKEPRRCLIMIAVMMVFWMLVRMCKFEIPYEMPTALRYSSINESSISSISSELSSPSSSNLTFIFYHPANFL